MNKKVYRVPQMSVVQAEPVGIMAASVVTESVDTENVMDGVNALSNTNTWSDIW